MNKEQIKISRTNDLEIPFLILITLSLLIGIVLVFNSFYLASIIFILVSLGMITFGTRTVLDFSNDIIFKSNIVFFIPIGKKERFSKTQFDSVSLTQFSDFSGFQYRTRSSRIRVQEYYVTLYSSSSNLKFKLPVFNDYKYASSILIQLKKNWNYTTHDSVFEKFNSNKIAKKR